MNTIGIAKFRRVLALGCSLGLVWSAPSYAQEQADELAELRSQLAAQAQRLDEQQRRLERQEEELNRLRIVIEAENVLYSREEIDRLRARGLGA